MPRAVTRYGGGAPGAGPGDVALGTSRARAAALLMLALPGSVFLYQGEELALPEVTDLPEDVLTDPMFHRTGGARRGRDGCRVPLPWTSTGPALGFSPAGATATPWLPQPDWFESHSVARQLACKESTLALYRDALTLRRHTPALASGDLHWLPTEPGVLAFTRGDTFACVVNSTTRLVHTPVDGQLLLASDPEAAEKMPPNSTAWFQL